MTDEEKAIQKKSNEYLLDHFTQIFRECVHEDILTHLEESYANGYKDGLAEGRKELEQWKQEWQDAQIKANEEGFARTTLQIKYSKLEKENAELKKEIEKRSMYEKHIEYENEQLKEQNENKREEIKMLRNEHKQDMVIHNNYVNKVEELKAHCKAVDEVNDKMKNCMNCRNIIADDEGVCADCNLFLYFVLMFFMI